MCRSAICKGKAPPPPCLKHTSPPHPSLGRGLSNSGPPPPAAAAAAPPGQGSRCSFNKPPWLIRMLRKWDSWARARRTWAEGTAVCRLLPGSRETKMGGSYANFGSLVTCHVLRDRSAVQRLGVGPRNSYTGPEGTRIVSFPARD